MDITKPKSLGPLIYRGSTGQGISFLRFLRVCVFFALLKKEFSQKQNKKKAPTRIVSNKRRLVLTQNLVPVKEKFADQQNH